jgi:hypothetical protein
MNETPCEGWSVGLCVGRICGKQQHSLVKGRLGLAVCIRDGTALLKILPFFLTFISSEADPFRHDKL